MADLVSVIIPTFNSAAYLTEALRSVAAQTHRNLEIIVVDDGSTDGTEALVKGAFPDARYLGQANSGAGAARNLGAQSARGDLFAFLDADDFWAPEKLALQLARLEREPAVDLVFGKIQQFHSPELSEEWRARIHCPSEPQTGIIPSAMLIRRRAFFEVGLFETRRDIPEFPAWYGGVVRLGLVCSVVDEVVAYRRLHSSNSGLAAADRREQYARMLASHLAKKRSPDK